MQAIIRDRLPNPDHRAVGKKKAQEKVGVGRTIELWIKPVIKTLKHTSTEQNDRGKQWATGHTSSQRQLRRTIPRSPQTGHVTGLIDQAYTACYKINVSVRIKIGDLAG